MIIKRIDVLSAAKIFGITAAAFGLLAGILVFLFGGVLGSLFGDAGGVGFVGGFMAIITMPIMYGIFGFIGGALQAFIYNLAAGFIGGIRIETE